MSLPSGYKRLEYIQSSGTQYVDTGVSAPSGFQADIDFKLASLSTTSTNDAIIGAHNDSAPYSRNYFAAKAAGFEVGVGEAYLQGEVPTTNERYMVDVSTVYSDIHLVVNSVEHSLTTDISATDEHSANTLYLLWCHGGSEWFSKCACKLYACRIYASDKLVRDFIPCISDTDEVGLWDDVNGVFYDNAGTGTFTAGPVIAIAVDESEITELEYIQSSGEQYINTAVSAPKGFRIVANVVLKSISNSLNMLFGSHDADSPYYRNFLAATGGGKWEIGAYNPYDFGTAAINTEYSIDVCTISGAVGCTINGETQSINASSTDSSVRSSRSIYLFGLNYPDGLLPASMQLSGLQLYLDSEKSDIVLDMISATLSDGTLGLYDKLHGLLYINVGTGSFTAGPEVQKAPTTPTGFTAAAITDTTVQLNWTASDGATGYKLYKNSDLLATLTETSYVDTVQAFSGTAYSITAYNDDGESEAAALTYYSTPENPILYLVTDRTAADVTARNEKGTYRSADLNRVGFAVQYLVDYLFRHGITVDVYPKRDWTDMGHPTPSDMRIYLNDISTLRAALKLPKDTATVPEDMVNLTYQEANDIESILVVLDEMIGKMISVVDAGWTSGMAYTGFYFKEATV